MCNRDLLKNSCYKLMLFLAILDLHTSLYTGALAGIISILGTVFCSAPYILFWLGCLNNVAWKIQSIATVLLAFNRCVDAFNESWSQKLFHGKRTYFWMAIPILWGLRDLLVGPPIIFSPIYSIIVYNPHAGYFEDLNFTYTDWTIFYNNVFVVVAIISIYTIFGILIYLKSKKATNKNVNRNVSLILYEVWG